jgi:hypothetical protein
MGLLDPQSPPLVPTLSGVLEKLTVTQLVNEFHAFYGTQRYITTFTEPATAAHYENEFNPLDLIPDPPNGSNYHPVFRRD